MKIKLCLLLFSVAVGGYAVAQTGELTLPQALNIARQRAPVILAARDQVEEVRGRLAGARILFQQNPAIDLSAGPRRLPGGNVTDYEIGASQAVELGGKRRSRIAGAQADLDRETAVSLDTARELLRDVATAFWRAVAAKERLRLARYADDNAAELLKGTQRRFDLGDVPILDVNVARNAAAKTRLELRSVETDQALALGDLRILLGINPTEPLSVSGDLNEHLSYQLGDLIAKATERPDIRALEAELRQAEAEIKLGKAFAIPDVTLGVSHGRDEGNTVTKGALGFTLPIFSRGQELRATGEARATRLRRQIAANRQAVTNEVTTAVNVYEQRVRAADELNRNAVQTVGDNETFARRSYEEGEINILDLLLIRRETFETQVLYLNTLLGAALQRVEVESGSGVLQ